jgi:serine/threonine protein kinase
MKYYCSKCCKNVKIDDSGHCLECSTLLAQKGLKKGTVIAGFEIDKELGRGANGVVYLGHQLSLERKVALKILPEDKAEDPEFVKNFLKEARAAAKLNHQNIVQAYDAGVTEDGIYFFAMELIDGETLDELIAREGALPFKKGLEIARKISGALDYSWTKQKLFHGDIKPDNIILRKDGEAKLSDLGLAKTIYEEKADEVMATPMYAPPEVIRGDKNRIGMKSDMYSFGATLYEIFAGEPPFNEPDPFKVLDMHLKDTHVPLSKKVPDIDHNLSLYVDRMLAKDPEIRPDNWREVTDFLRSVHIGKTEETPPEKNKSLNWILAGIISLVVLTLICGGTIYYYLSKEKQPELISSLDSSYEREPFITPIDSKQSDTPPVKTKVPSTEKSPKQSPAIDAKQQRIKELQKRFQKLQSTFANKKIVRLSGIQGTEIQRNISSINSLAKVLTGALSAKQLSWLKTKQDELTKASEYERNAAAQKRTKKLRIIIQQERKLAEQTKQMLKKSETAVNGYFNYFKFYKEFFGLELKNRTHSGLEKSLKQVNFKSLPGNFAARIRFLQQKIPVSYSNNQIFINNASKITGLFLPWNLEGYKFKVSSVDNKCLRMITKLSEGAYSRRKIYWRELTDSDTQRLLESWVFEKQFEFSKKDAEHTAAQLFAEGKLGLLQKMATAVFTGKEQQMWTQCALDAEKYRSELNAASIWQQANSDFKAGNFYRSGQNLELLKSKYPKTSLYKSVQDADEYYFKRIEVFSPEYCVKNILKQISTNGSTRKKLIALCAYNRYATLKKLPRKLRQELVQKRHNSIREFSGNRRFAGNFGLFGSLQAGAIWGWSAPKGGAKLKELPLLYLPALMDIDDWHRINYLMRHLQLSLDSIAEIKKHLGSWYPSLVYCMGLAGLRYEDKSIVNYTASVLQSEAGSGSNSYNTALANDFLIKIGQVHKAQKQLQEAQFSVSNNGLLLALIKLKSLMALPKVDEESFSALCAQIVKKFNQNELTSTEDLKAVSLAAKIVTGVTITNSELRNIRLKKAEYPALCASLLCEATARGIWLERNNVPLKRLAAILSPAIGNSVFDADLLWISFLLNTSSELTPAKLKIATSQALEKITPATTPNYPEFMILNAAALIKSNEISSSKMSNVLSNFITWCPIFSKTERQAVNILSSKFPVKIFSSISAIEKRKIIVLGILTASVEKSKGKQQEVFKRLLSIPDLSWSERLFIRNYSEMLGAE